MKRVNRYLDRPQKEDRRKMATMLDPLNDRRKGPACRRNQKRIDAEIRSASARTVFYPSWKLLPVGF